MEYVISASDKKVLREVARKQLDYANQESNKRKIKEWYLHNDLKGDKPMVQLEMGTFEHEILPKRQQCQGRFARQVEAVLYRNFMNQELLEDDRVTPDYYPLNYDTSFQLFDIALHEHHTTDNNGNESVGYQFDYVIRDLEEDFHILKPSRFSVDMETTEEKKEAINEAIGDILPVKIQMDSFVSVPTQMVVRLMGMETMMFSMYDYPELFKKMMDRIAEDTIAYYRMLEEQQMIMPTSSFVNVRQGTWGFTHDLPGWDEWEKRPFTTKDSWGFMDSQESVSISPEMYEEFIFPCYQKISDQFGLFSYGCCEPVDPIWDRCVSKFKNLRKVSVSPWCNEEIMGEKLQGRDVIYHRKPSPNFLGVGKVLDEEALRAHIRKSLLAAQGCKMEITQRDVYTIHHDIIKAKRYVDIIREEIENHWKG